MSLFNWKKKVLGYTPQMGGGGSGGGSTQSTGTTYNTNIPEYARPYVENMLGATQKQLFTTKQVGASPGQQVQIGTDMNGEPLYETVGATEGTTEITGFKPYQAYGAKYDPKTGQEIPGSYDAGKYVAGFQPLQEKAMGAAGQLQVPGQFGTATDLANQAGYGSLSALGQAQGLQGQALGYGQVGSMYGGQGAQQAMQTAQQTGRQAGMYGGMGSMYGRQAAGLAPQAQAYGQGAADIGMGGLGYGAMGSQYGQQAAQAAQQGYGAGAQYAQQATNPNSIAAYMSPYMQNVVDYQKSQAARDYSIGQQGRKAQAVGQGAFGGSRQAIMESEAQRNLMSQLGGIEAQGAQSAFQNAQQAQQFGANLGLQGLQAGYQGTGMGIQGAQTGLQGLGTAMQGQQAGLQGLQQAGSLYGQGMQGAQVGLQGVGAQQAAGQLGLQGTAQGIQGAQAGLQGVQGAVGAGQYGLAGLGQAGQAASTLGTLGGQQLGAQKDIIGTQYQMGAQQQALEQQKINQAIQDWANTQQYPLMQLGVMSNMLRGLPMQAATTNQYVASPNSITQGIGLAGAGASIFNALKKEGGIIREKKMASGGIAGYSVGGSIKSKLYDMSPADIQEYIKESSSPMAKDIAEEVLRDKTGKAGGGIIAFQNRGLVPEPQSNEDKFFADLEAKKEAERAPYREMLAEERSRLLSRAPAPAADPAMVAQSYIDAAKAQAAANKPAPAAAPTPAPVEAPPANPASIVAARPREDYRSAPPGPTQAERDAFYIKDKVPADKVPADKAAAPSKVAAPGQGNINAAPSSDLMPTAGIKFPTAPKDDIGTLEERMAAFGTNEGNQKARAELMAERANSKDEARRATALRMAEFFGAWGSTPGNTIVAGLNALKNKVPDFIGDMKEEAKIRKQINKDIAELDRLDREEEKGIKKDYFAERSKLADRAMHKYGYELTAASSRYSADAGVRAASIRSSAAGGENSVGKLYNQAVIRYQTETKNIEAAKKEDKEYRMAVAKLAANPKDADAAAAKARKEATWDSRLEPLKEDMDYYKKKAGREPGESSAAPTDTAKPKIIKLD